MLLYDILDAKFIEENGEGDRPIIVIPHITCVLGMGILIPGQVLHKALVGDYNGWVDTV